MRVEVAKHVVDLAPFFRTYCSKDNLRNLPDSLPVSGVCFDSRKVEPGNVFVCLPGAHSDGNQFIAAAIVSGASCVVSQLAQQLTAPSVVVPDVYQALADIADQYYDHPSKTLRLIGITGTNGKTTTTHLVQHIFNTAGKKTGLIGTIGTRGPVDTDYRDAGLTTPQASDMVRLLYEMHQQGCTHVCLEVSSHALALKRVGACQFDVAALTNITQDHLDFHKTMDNYIQTKLLLFEGLNHSEKSNKAAIVNLDDPAAHLFLRACGDSVSKVTYGFAPECDVRVISVTQDFRKSKIELATPVGLLDFETQLVGRFNVYNIMTAVAIAIAEGVPLPECAAALANFPGVPGRFQVVSSGAAAEPLCIVDYAHTPDGLENVLRAARDLVPEHGRLIVVFGCGGDRDATKRPKMGKIAATEADVVIVTSDNPRSEKPQRIVDDVLAGISNMDKTQVKVDRETAIKLAVAEATYCDVVVVAGKGHENYQVLADRTIPFDDRTEVLAALRSRTA